MRCVHLIRDDLHDYAEAMLTCMENLLSLRPVTSMAFGDFETEVVNRRGNLQTELVRIDPGVKVPLHCHPGVDSIDLLVDGSVSLVVGETRIPRPLKGIGIRIAQDALHGGVVGPEGVMFLSCQRWDRLPDFIARSWSGATVSEAHERMLEHLKAVA